MRFVYSGAGRHENGEKTDFKNQGVAEATKWSTAKMCEKIG